MATDILSRIKNGSAMIIRKIESFPTHNTCIIGEIHFIRNGKCPVLSSKICDHNDNIYVVIVTCEAATLVSQAGERRCVISLPSSRCSSSGWAFCTSPSCLAAARRVAGPAPASRRTNRRSNLVHS